MFTAWHYRRYHTSILIGWIAFGVLAGLALAKLTSALGSLIWLGAGLSMLPIVFLQRRGWSIALAIMAGALIGLQRGGNEIHALQTYDELIGQKHTVGGTITDDPQLNERSQTEFSLSSIHIDKTAVKGRIYVSVTGKKSLKRGDQVVIYGKLGDGFGSYQATLRFGSILATSSGATPIRDLRESFSHGVRETVMEPEASLGLGFVVGQRSALPPDLDDQLKIVGLTHIVVASGYNLTILVRFARRLFAKYSRFAAFSISSAMVVGFIAFSGLTPSMIRAGAVTLLSLLAWYYGRRFHPLLLIAYVAAGSAYWDPIYLWGDIGWYLSFLAFIGVLIVAPLLTSRLYGTKKPGAIAQLLIETVAATLLTLPLILLSFERLPILSLLANVLVAPVIPFAMLATTIAGGAGMMAIDSLSWLGIPATVIIGYIVWVVEALSSLSWAQVDMTIPAMIMLAAYLTICIVTYIWWRKTKYNFLSSSIVE